MYSVAPWYLGIVSGQIGSQLCMFACPEVKLYDSSPNICALRLKQGCFPLHCFQCHLMLQFSSLKRVPENLLAAMLWLCSKLSSGLHEQQPTGSMPPAGRY